MLAATGATAEGDDDVGTELWCQFNGRDEVIVMLLGEALLWVHRIAVHCQRRADQSVIFEQRVDALLLLLAAEHLLWIKVRLAGPCAHWEFNGAEANVSDVIANIFKGAAGKER